MKSTTKLEICANSVVSVIAAEHGGAHRVELCSNLAEGGVTPSFATIKLAREESVIDLFVLIRPRPGDFCYSDIEFEIMKSDVQLAKELGADGIVTGILKPDGHIDIERTMELVELAKPMQVTFHRAFDVCFDPFIALEEIIDMGITRILTSGQKQTAIEGAELIAELVRKSSGRIIIMPGSGIREYNIAELQQKTGAFEFHSSAQQMFPSRMNFKSNEISMGGSREDKKDNIYQTCANTVKLLIANIN